MKLFKWTSLVLLICGFFGVAAHGFYTLGRHTEYNRLLWSELTRAKPLPRFETLEEQKDMYNEMKFSFALPTKGDN